MSSFDRAATQLIGLFPALFDLLTNFQRQLHGRGGDWSEVARAAVHPVGWTATFRVEGWDSSRDAEYRVRHSAGATYSGRVRRDPVDQRVVVAAAFTGNSPGPGGGTISKRDVVENVRKVDPDVLLFTGDQVYNHTRHTEHWLAANRSQRAGHGL